MSQGMSMTTQAQERRRQIHALRQANNDWPTIAETIGLKESTCRAYYKAAIELDGLPATRQIAERGHVANETAVADVMTLASATVVDDERFRELREACKKAGMKPSLVAAIIRRMRAEFAAPMQEMRKLSLKEMTDQIESKIGLTLSGMDEYAVATASFKDQAIALGILVDRHQLLMGRPTQIIDQTQRMQLQQLLPAVLAEAQRRGITVDVQMVEVVK